MPNKQPPVTAGALTLEASETEEETIYCSNSTRKFQEQFHNPPGDNEQTRGY